MKSTVTRIEPELKSAAAHSKQQDKISLKLYSSAGTQVTRGRESVATRIQASELDSAVTCIQSPKLMLAAEQNQPQLVFSCRYMYIYIYIYIYKVYANATTTVSDL